MSMNVGKAIGMALGGAPVAAMGLGKKLFDSATGATAAQDAMEAESSPNNRALPQIPGYTNKLGIPQVPIPVYQGAPVLPYNMPNINKPVLAPPSQGEVGQGSALNASRAASMAMLEPTSAALQDLTNAEGQLGKIDFLKGLRDVMTANRHSRAQGRGGLFDNERNDESLSRMIQQNAQVSEAGARTRAMDRLRGFSGDMNNLASGYGNLASTTRNRTQDFTNLLNTYINNMRADAGTRNSQQRFDVATKVDQQREDVNNFLNLINKAGPAMAQAKTGAAANNYAGNMAFIQPFISMLSGGFGGMV